MPLQSDNHFECNLGSLPDIYSHLQLSLFAKTQDMERNPPAGFRGVFLSPRKSKRKVYSPLLLVAGMSEKEVDMEESREREDKQGPW